MALPPIVKKIPGIAGVATAADAAIEAVPWIWNTPDEAAKLFPNDGAKQREYIYKKLKKDLPKGIDTQVNSALGFIPGLASDLTGMELPEGTLKDIVDNKFSVTGLAKNAYDKTLQGYEAAKQAYNNGQLSIPSLDTTKQAVNSAVSFGPQALQSMSNWGKSDTSEPSPKPRPKVEQTTDGKLLINVGGDVENSVPEPAVTPPPQPAAKPVETPPRRGSQEAPGKPATDARKAPASSGRGKGTPKAGKGLLAVKEKARKQREDLRQWAGKEQASALAEQAKLAAQRKSIDDNYAVRFKGKPTSIGDIIRNKVKSSRSLFS